MIYIFISFIDNLALFYLSLDGTLFPDDSRRKGVTGQVMLQIPMGRETA